MGYQALYRKYRPRTFSDVVGQDVIVKTLKNAIITNKIAHAYLFSGPRGTGKTSLAKIFSSAVNCEANKKDAPCGVCASCKAILEESISDVIEIDAASNNGVDEIRELRDKVKYMPALAKYKVYIIDEVHMLTMQAFNALLKTLEEPPAHVIFILATTEANKVPLTILSRCQRFDFRGITPAGIEKKLVEIIEKEKIEIQSQAIKEIAKQSDGGLRDAISLLDQVVSFASGTITVKDIDDVSGSVSKENLEKLLSYILLKDIGSAFSLLEKIIEDGKEVFKITSDLILIIRDMLLVKNTDEADDNYKADLKKLAKDFSNDKLFFYLDILNETQGQLRWTNQKRAYLELAVIKMIDHQMLERLDTNEQMSLLMNKVNQLELDFQTLKKTPVVKVKNNLEKAEETPLETEQTNHKYKQITVGDIQEILHNGNKEKRNRLTKYWSLLEKIDDPHLQITASLLSKGEVVACSKNKMVLVYPDKTTCLMMLSQQYKENALKVLNRKEKLIDDYLCINQENWDILFEAFKKQWDLGNKKPKLPEIDLNLYEIKEETWKSETEKLAIDFFGEDLVKLKEE